MGNRGKIGKKKGQKPTPNSQEKQLTVCYICGDRGFSNAFVECSECSDISAHQYCLGIAPGSVDDTYSWSCKDCCGPVASESYFPKTAGASSVETEEPCKEQVELPKLESKKAIVLVKDEPQPLQIILPISYNRSSEKTEASNIYQTAEGTFRTSCTSTAGETSTSLWWHQPEEGISETVLVASPSGEVIICTSMKFNNASPSPSTETSILNVTDDENASDCSIEKTIELEEPIDGNDEETDTCHSSRTVGITKIEEYLKEHIVQLVNGGSKVDSLYQEGLKKQQLDAKEESIEPIYSSMPIDEKADVPKMAVEFHECNSKEGITQVGSYKIRSELALILRKIIHKHGDIFCNCVIESNDSLLVNVCEAIQELQRVPLNCLQHQHVDHLRNASKLLKDSGADVKWLNHHCDYLELVVHQQKQYSILKQEKSLSLKRAKMSELLEEIMVLEREIQTSKSYREDLECIIEEIKSKSRRFLGKTLADGLY